MSEIYGFRVDGTVYQYDYNHLANKPPALPTWYCGDEGKVLMVGNCGAGPVWADPPEGSLPTRGNDDHDKVLGIDHYGDLAWMDGCPVPTWDCGDMGKVLGLTEWGDLEWKEIPGIPPIDSSDANKFLAVDDSGDHAEWRDLPASKLPTFGSQDIGKVLTVADSGTLEWRALPT
jgi:hypothetical protein